MNGSVNVETLSMSWLNLAVLNMTVEQFLKEKDNQRALVSVADTSSVEDAAEKLLVENVHQVLVTSAHGPTLLTPANALRTLLQGTR